MNKHFQNGCARAEKEIQNKLQNAGMRVENADPKSVLLSVGIKDPKLVYTSSKGTIWEGKNSLGTYFYLFGKNGGDKGTRKSLDMAKQVLETGDYSIW